MLRVADVQRAPARVEHHRDVLPISLVRLPGVARGRDDRAPEVERREQPVLDDDPRAAPMDRAVDRRRPCRERQVALGPGGPELGRAAADVEPVGVSPAPAGENVPSGLRTSRSLAARNASTATGGKRSAGWSTRTGRCRRRSAASPGGAAAAESTVPATAAETASETTSAIQRIPGGSHLSEVATSGGEDFVSTGGSAPAAPGTIAPDADVSRDGRSRVPRLPSL